jgi:hypothetical protein
MRRGENVNKKLELVLEEGDADAVLCEEYIALIGSTFNSAVVSRAESEETDQFDITDRFQFVHWILGSLRSTPDRAVDRLSDLFLQLHIPKFLLDIGKCAMHIRLGKATLRSKAILEKISEKLEATLAFGTLLSEPDYLRFVYQLLADLCEQFGDADRARFYIDRTTDDYFERRLSEVKGELESEEGQNRLAQVVRNERDQLMYDGYTE